MQAVLSSSDSKNLYLKLYLVDLSHIAVDSSKLSEKALQKDILLPKIAFFSMCHMEIDYYLIYSAVIKTLVIILKEIINVQVVVGIRWYIYNVHFIIVNRFTDQVGVII